MWTCPICGHDNPDDLDVCEECGSYREEPCYDIESDLTDEEDEEDV
jgi:uncharacterized membrane protein YvbJ